MHKCIATTLCEAGDFEAALRNFSLALSINPKVDELHAILAHFYLNSANQVFHDSAKAIHHAWLSAETSRYRKRDNFILLAMAYMDAGRYREGARAAEKVLDFSVTPSEIRNAREAMEKLVVLESRKTAKAATNVITAPGPVVPSSATAKPAE